MKLADALVGTMELLNRIAPKGSNIQAWAEANAADLRQFVKEDRRKSVQPVSKRQATTFRGSRKRAEIEMHNDPKFRAPRPDMRTHMDQDVKKEIEADLED